MTLLWITQGTFCYTSGHNYRRSNSAGSHTHNQMTNTSRGGNWKGVPDFYYCLGGCSAWRLPLFGYMHNIIPPKSMPATRWHLSWHNVLSDNHKRQFQIIDFRIRLCAVYNSMTDIVSMNGICLLLLPPPHATLWCHFMAVNLPQCTPTSSYIDLTVACFSQAAIH